jgi:hypothetical protein
MAGLAKTSQVKKAKKHGVKAGQKHLVRPSQKKSVKNGRHQEKETPKKKTIKKAVAAIPADLEGPIVEEDEYDEFTQEAQFDEGESPYEFDEADDKEY